MNTSPEPTALLDRAASIHDEALAGHFASFSPWVHDSFASHHYALPMSGAARSRHADPEVLLDDLTCWIVELNLAGKACNPRVCDAARSAVVAALRSGAGAAEALAAGKAVVSRYLEQPCS